MTAPEPGWAYEPISIVDPNPNWPAQADRLCAQLRRLLDRWQISDIQHIGSTAVPGLAAKPILDLMAGCTDLDQAPEIASALAGYGWHYVPLELDEQPHRRFFVLVIDGHRHAHLHLMRPGAEHWQRHLAFRDELRADPQLRQEYAALKQRLAAAHIEDREAYTQAKAGSIEQVLSRRPA